MAHVWFNTAFIENNQLVLPKPVLDTAWKDRKNKKFKQDFQITLHFKGAEESSFSSNKEDNGNKNLVEENNH